MKTYLNILIILIVSITQLYSQTSILNSENTEAKLLEVEQMMGRGDYRNAISLLHKIEEEEPQNLSILFNLGFCYLKTGRADVTKTYMGRYIDRNKNYYPAYNLKGIACQRLGEADSAIIYFTKAIKLDDKLQEAFFNRGNIYISQSRFKKALKDFLKVKKIGKNNQNINIMLAQTYVGLRKYKNALKEYMLALKFKPKDFMLIKSIANVLVKLKKYKEAIKYYSKALNIEPDNIEALNNRMMCYNNIEEESEKAELDGQRIKQIQKEKGVQTDLLSYKMVSPQDKSFLFRIPKNWRAFVAENKDSTVIKFFNPEFKNVVNAEEFYYSFGGELKIKKHIKFKDKKDIKKSMAIVSEKYMKDRLNESQKYIYYRPTFKKLFNPTDKLHRGLIKAKIQKDEMDEELVIHEYHAITNSGWFVTLYIWVPEKDAFYYENLLEFIISSLKINS